MEDVNNVIYKIVFYVTISLNVPSVMKRETFSWRMGHVHIVILKDVKIVLMSILVKPANNTITSFRMELVPSFFVYFKDVFNAPR